MSISSGLLKKLKIGPNFGINLRIVKKFKKFSLPSSFSLNAENNLICKRIRDYYCNGK